MLGGISPNTGQISAAAEPNWKEIEITIDSGACDSVMPTGEVTGESVMPRTSTGLITLKPDSVDPIMRCLLTTYCGTDDDRDHWLTCPADTLLDTCALLLRTGCPLGLPVTIPLAERKPLRGGI